MLKPLEELPNHSQAKRTVQDLGHMLRRNAQDQHAVHCPAYRLHGISVCFLLSRFLQRYFDELMMSPSTKIPRLTTTMNLLETEHLQNAAETPSGRRSILANVSASSSAGGVPPKAKRGATCRRFSEDKGSSGVSKSSGIACGTNVGSGDGVRQCMDLKLSLRQRLDK